MAIFKLDTGVLGEDFNLYQIRNVDTRSFTPKDRDAQGVKEVKTSRLALGRQRGQGECQRRCQVWCQRQCQVRCRMDMRESEGPDGCQKGFWMGDGGCDTVDVDCVVGAEAEEGIKRGENQGTEHGTGRERGC